jgi:hypothetical protein
MKQKKGNVYYIKLNTNLGVFYKIGYTSKSSVEKRFSYGNSTNYLAIAEVLRFDYYDNALLEEQILHDKFKDKRAFPKFSNKPYLPFAGDGQSELYYEDVLNLDDKYSNVQKWLTKGRVLLITAKNNPLEIFALGSTIYMFIGLTIITFPIGPILGVLFLGTIELEQRKREKGSVRNFVSV